MTTSTPINIALLMARPTLKSITTKQKCGRLTKDRANKPVKKNRA